MDQGSPSTWLEDGWESAHDDLMLLPERQLLPPMGEEQEEQAQHQHQHQHHEHQHQDHEHQELAGAAIELVLQEDETGVPGGSRRKGRGPGRNVTRCQNCRASKTRCCFRRSWPCRPQRSRRKDAPPEERQARPLIDVVFQRANPKPQAELFKRVFLEVAREGHVDRALAVRTLRIWQNISLIAEADVTWGIGALVAKELGIASTEVEDTEALLLDRRREDRRRQALEYVSRLSAVEGALRASEVFQRADDGRVPILMTVTDGDRMLHQATNHPYERLVKSALALFDECIQRKTLQPLLIASLIGHEDRGLWMRGIVQSLLTTGRYAHVAIFIKMFDPVEGDVRLTIAQADQVEMDGEHGVIYRMEPTPPSRHITDRPEISRVMKTFRRVRPLGDAIERYKPTKSRVPASTADEITALKLGGRGGGSVDTSGGASDGKDGRRKAGKPDYDTEAEEDEDTADEAEEVAAEDEQQEDEEGADESSEDAGRRFPFAASSRALKALGGAPSSPAALAALNSFPFLASLPGRWPRGPVNEEAGKEGERVAAATSASRQTQTTAGTSSQSSAAALEAPSSSSMSPPANMGGGALSPRTVERLFAEAARAMAAAVTEQEKEDNEEAEAEAELALKPEGPPQRKPRRAPPLFYAAARRRREQRQREKEAKEEAERQRQLQLQQHLQALGSGVGGSLSMGSSSFSSPSYGLSGSASSSGSLQFGYAGPQGGMPYPSIYPQAPHEATALIAATAASLSWGQAPLAPPTPLTAATAAAGHGAVGKDASSYATMGPVTSPPSHEALAWTLLRLRAAHCQATGEGEAKQGDSSTAGK